MEEETQVRIVYVSQDTIEEGDEVVGDTGEVVTPENFPDYPGRGARN